MSNGVVCCRCIGERATRRCRCNKTSSTDTRKKTNDGTTTSSDFANEDSQPCIGGHRAAECSERCCLSKGSLWQVLVK